VEVQTSFLSDMIFEGGDFVEVMGKTPRGQFSADAVRQLLNYHFRHSMDTHEEWVKFIRQLLIYGTSIFKMFWKVKSEWKTSYIPKYNELGEVTGYEPYEMEELSANQPSVYTVDLFHFGVDPNSANVSDARYAYERMWVDPHDLVEKQNLGIYKNVEKVLVGDGGLQVNEGLRERYAELKLTAHQESPYVQRGKVQIIDYWGYLSSAWKNTELSKNAKSQLYHVVLAVQGTASSEGNPTVLLAEPTPFHHNRLPYVDARLNNCVGEFYGTGDIEYCESLLDEQMDMRNIQLENMKRTINRMFLVDRSANISPAQLIWRAGGIIDVDDTERSVKVLDVPPLDPTFFKAQEDIRRDIEQVTGVNDFIMGQYRSSTGFNDTATGISMIQQVALKRIAHKGQVVQTAIKDAAHMMFALLAQFQRKADPVRILDPDAASRIRFIDISPDALQQEYDFSIVNSPAMGSKQVRQNQLIQLFQIMVQAQGAGAQIPPDFFNLFPRRLIEEMDIPNPNDFLGHNLALGQGLPPGLEGTQPESDEFLSPEEENRIMVEQGKFVNPKLQENHVHHMAVHMEAYDQIDNPTTKNLVSEHYNLHAKLKEQTAEIASVAMSTEMQAQALQQQQVAAQDLLGNTKGNKSPNNAGGNEDIVRLLGNQMAGNV